MWIAFTLLTFACWGIADLFYKIGNKDKGDYNQCLIICNKILTEDPSEKEAIKSKIITLINI